MFFAVWFKIVRIPCKVLLQNSLLTLYTCFCRTSGCYHLPIILLFQVISINVFHSFDCCSWRALRVQKNLSNKGDKSPKSSPSSSKNNWLEDLCSFDIEEDDDDVDMEELSRQLSEAASLSSNGKKQNSCSKSKKKSIGQSTRSSDVSIPGGLHAFILKYLRILNSIKLYMSLFESLLKRL